MSYGIQPQIRTTETKVIDCLEQIIKTKLPITGPVPVDRNYDPRALDPAHAEDFREKGSLVRFRLGKWKWLQGKDGTVGDVRRKHMDILAVVYQTLRRDQDSAKVTLDQIQAWMRHDIEWQIAKEGAVAAAAADLVTMAGPWGGPGTWGPAPGVMNLAVIEGECDPEDRFPYAKMAQVIAFDFDEHGPDGLPGTPS